MTPARASGILLHPTSLPGPFGIGDLGPAAGAFVDFLAGAGQRYWQVLPLGPIGWSNSPYQSYSAFAGNTLLISPERLLDEGLLRKDDLAETPTFPEGHVVFEAAGAAKRELLAKACRRFREGAATGLKEAFQTFCTGHAVWLDDFALFCVLRRVHGGAAWNRWELPLAYREPSALDRARSEFRSEIEAEKFLQFLFFRQWSSLRRYGHDRGVRIIGDVPIFAAHDSADVWTHRELFKLDADGNPRFMAGVPPDYFSQTGQVWENPVYDWPRMQADRYRWWIARVRAILELADVVRIDHFRGFAAYWEIPGGDATAERGQWVPGPGGEFFESLRSALGELPFLAEDLGTITPDVESLRDACGFPGSRVLQFGFSEDSGSRHLPHNYPHNVVAYTGTHDNNTIVGWLQSTAGADSTRGEEQVRRDREFALQYIHCQDPKEVHWDAIRAVSESRADTAIFPLQDVLGLGAEARMNVPGTRNGNWGWRYRTGSLTDDARRRLREITERSGRLSSP